MGRMVFYTDKTDAWRGQEKRLVLPAEPLHKEDGESDRGGKAKALRRKITIKKVITK